MQWLFLQIVRNFDYRNMARIETFAYRVGGKMRGTFMHMYMSGGIFESCRSANRVGRCRTRKGDIAVAVERGKYEYIERGEREREDKEEGR